VSGHLLLRPSRPLALLLVAALSLCACSESRPDLVRLPEAAPPALFVRNVAVLDVARGHATPARDVLLAGDRIAAIGTAGALPTPADAEVIDGSGGTLIPGLIDCHGHVWGSYAPVWASELPDPEHNLQAFLYSGVTTLLDPADSGDEAVSRRDRIRRGELLGPRIYTAGRPITTPGGHPVAMVREVAPWWIGWYVAPRTAHQVRGEEQARRTVAALSDGGVDFLKVIVDRLPDRVPRIDDTTLAAAVDEARRRELRAVAHIGSLQDALDAARAGVAAWVHGVYKEPLDATAARELAGFGIPMVPTTVVFESYALLSDYARDATKLERQIAPAALLDAFNVQPEDTSLQEAFGPFLAALRAQRTAWRENVRLLRDAGVTILAGSDVQSGVVPGAGLHRELALLHESGLTPAQVIRAATLDPARFLEGTEDPDVGQIELGKRADLVLVNGDPTRDIEALSDIREVILGGVRVERFPLGSAGAD
jgi:imidazolonepropionase-like amidohydrolase